MEKLMELFERYVASQEKIADAMMAQVKTRPIKVEMVAGEPPVKSLSPTEGEPKAIKDMDREEIKAELVIRKISYKENQHTDTLAKMLTADRKANAVPEANTVDATLPHAAPPVPGAGAPELTLEVVRNALMEYAKIDGNGTEAVIKICKSVGSDNVSGITPDKYPEVMAQIN